MCTTFVAKLVLGIINTLVFLAGLAMFIVGLVLHTEPALSQKALSSLLEQLKATASQAGVADLDTSAFSVADIAYSFTIAIIVIGIFLAAVSLLGLIGVKYSLKIVLIVYFVITLVLFLAQVIIVLIAVIDRSVFDDAVKPRLKTTIKDYYTGLEGTDGTTQTWNGIQIELQCCGVDSFEDYTDATKWTKTIQGVNHALLTPVTCCKTVTTNFACATAPTDATNNWKTGCYTKIWDFVISNSGIVIGIATGVLLAQLVILLLTCVIMNSSGKVTGV